MESSPLPQPEDPRLKPKGSQESNLILLCLRDLETAFQVDQLQRPIVLSEPLGDRLPMCGNPQLIFESMSSTGRKLSQADLIRNYGLMGLERALQTRLYQDNWRPM